MIKLITVAGLFLLASFQITAGVFDLGITLPDGTEKPLSDYQGKKLMITVLPVTRTHADSSLLLLLDTLSRKYADSVTIIGIPSYEDGFEDDSLAVLAGWYQSLAGGPLVIANGMSTRKASPYQTPLFSYLTHAEENGYFDDDVYGAGEQFFTDNTGRLTGISTPGADFNETIFLTMLTRSPEQ